MKYIILISLIVIVSVVNCEESFSSSLFSRRIPSQAAELQSRNLHGQFNQPESSHQMRSALHQQQQQQHAFAGQQDQHQSRIDTRKVERMISQMADQTSLLMSHWARALKERIDQDNSESSSFGPAQSHGSRIH